MKIAIFGATGRTGNQLVRKALHDGHEVSILTRQIKKVCFDPEEIRITEGNVLSLEKVKETIKGADVVISALGADDISKPIRMFSGGIENIIEAMKEEGIKRFIGMSGAGILDHPDGDYRGNIDLAPFLQYIFPDQLQAFETLKESDLDWTMVCPTLMPEGRGSGAFRTEMNMLPEDPKPVSVGDVAALIYKIFSENLYSKTRVGVAN